MMTNNEETEATLNLYKIYKMKYCGRACHHEEDESLENNIHQDKNPSFSTEEIKHKEGETVDIILTNQKFKILNTEKNLYKLIKKKFVSQMCYHEIIESEISYNEIHTLQHSNCKERNNDAVPADLTKEIMCSKRKPHEVQNRETNIKSANEVMDYPPNCVLNITKKKRRIVITQKENHKPLTRHAAKRLKCRPEESRKEKIDGSLQHTSQSPQTAAKKEGKICSCFFCPSKFSHNSVLGRHMKQEHNNDTYKCDMCSKTYLSYGRLNQHKKRSHSIVDGNYKCLVCTLYFSNPIALGRHYASCHKNKDLKCEKCGRKFKRYVILAQHIKRRHTDHPCNKCDRVFESQNLLRNHDLKRHSNGQKTKLIRHITPYTRTLYKYDSYQCYMCDKKFNDKNNLRKHVFKVELKLKGREKCRICKARYHTKSELKNHLKKHKRTRRGLRF